MLQPRIIREDRVTMFCSPPSPRPTPAAGPALPGRWEFNVFEWEGI